MKKVKKYKELTRESAIELLRENDWRPVEGVVFRDNLSDDWVPRELHGVLADDSPFRTNLACWNHAALPIEEIEWEVGDTVEVIRCSESHQFETGVKGVVVGVNEDDNPIVQQTSPAPKGCGRCPINAKDLKQWTPDHACGLVRFAGPEDLPDWPMIWVTHSDTADFTIVMRVSPKGVFLHGRSTMVTWVELYAGYYISPDRKNWQVAGKEVEG